jgi:hypothetical protein
MPITPKVPSIAPTTAVASRISSAISRAIAVVTQRVVVRASSLWNGLLAERRSIATRPDIQPSNFQPTFTTSNASRKEGSAESRL